MYPHASLVLGERPVVVRVQLTEERVNVVRLREDIVHEMPDGLDLGRRRTRRRIGAIEDLQLVHRCARLEDATLFDVFPQLRY